MTALEQAARALSRYFHVAAYGEAKWSPGELDRVVDNGWRTAIPAVEVVIAVLRDPTAEMIEAACPLSETDRLAFAQMWRAMCDEVVADA